MTGKYPYECEQFGVSGSAIHLLRNGYNHKTIAFDNIDSMVIMKGKELRNWILVLIIALSLIVFVAMDIFWLFGFLTNAQPGPIYIERLLIPVLPLALGIYMLIVAFRTTMVMKVFSKGKYYYLSLQPFMKRGSFSRFCTFVREVYPNLTIR